MIEKGHIVRHIDGPEDFLCRVSYLTTCGMIVIYPLYSGIGYEVDDPDKYEIVEQD